MQCVRIAPPLRQVDAFGRNGFTFVEAYAKKGITRAQLQRLINTALHGSPLRAYTATGDEQYNAVVATLKQTTSIFQAMQIAVVLASITLLTRHHRYVWAGVVLGVVGVAIAAAAE